MFGKTKNDNIFIILKNYIYEMSEKVKEEKLQEKMKEEALETQTREQLKLFRLFFVIFFMFFLIVLIVSSFSFLYLWALLFESIVALVSYILFKHPPKRVKYKNVFLMPVVAFGCTIFLNAFFFIITPVNAPNSNNSEVITEQTENSQSDYTLDLTR